MTLDDLPYFESILKSPLDKLITFDTNDCRYSGSACDLIVNCIHPMLIKAKKGYRRGDNPNLWEAIHSTFSNDYCRAACKEVKNLEKMRYWDIVDCTSDMNVLEPTWEFKLSRFISGLINKTKDSICARGHQQLEGVDYFKTFVPVFQWNTVILIIILEMILDLKSKQGHVTAAFLHDDVPEGENSYVVMPRGLIRKENDLNHEGISIN